MLDSSNLFELILQGSWVSQLVLLVLVVMSSLSWAIIVLKWLQLRRANKNNSLFYQVFYDSPKLDAIYQTAQAAEGSPFARVFEKAYQELLQFHENHRETLAAPSLSQEWFHRLHVRLQRTLEYSVNQQYALVERQLGILAIVSSSAPFVGLFGTVLGIIDAFQNIGMEGVTSLAVVAPGISEALIATAAGLLAAIPALIAYNHYLNRARQFGKSLHRFSLELSNRIEGLA